MRSWLPIHMKLGSVLIHRAIYLRVVVMYSPSARRADDPYSLLFVG